MNRRGAAGVSTSMQPRLTRKRLLTCAAAACLTLAGGINLFADDVLRHVQQLLRDQGFYYGSIDGSPGDETTQAIRRYQIRNGLPVSGELDDATRKSIDRTEATVHKGASSSPSIDSATAAEDRQYAQSSATPPPLSRTGPAPAPRFIPGTGDDDSGPAAVPAPAPPTAPSRPDLRVPATGGGSAAAAPGGAVLPSPNLTEFFEQTPYEFAPPPVQADVLRHAQAALLRSGFYDGVADGVPGPRTAEALSNYQEVCHIRATGRLDVRTLAILRLLPPSQPAPRLYRGPAPGGVYEGRIVH